MYPEDWDWVFGSKDGYLGSVAGASVSRFSVAGTLVLAEHPAIFGFASPLPV